MAGIQLSGLASGLDTQSIISQLMAVEGLGRTRITFQQAKEQSRHDVLQSIQGKLSMVQSAAQALASAGTWGNSQTAESADPTKVTATIAGGAGPGGYEVTVSKLAAAEQHVYNFTSQAGASSLTVNGQNVDLAAGATIDDAVTAINANSAANVFAVKVGTGQIALAAKTTGTASAFTASGASLAEDATQFRAGADAQFTIGTTSYTRSSNIVSDALPGVTLTLKGTSTSPTTVTVSNPGPSPDAIVSATKAFVDAYNAAIDAIRGPLTEKSVADPANSNDAKKGALFADTSLSGVLDNLRSIAGTALSSVGVSTGAASATINADSVSGKLALDETALRNQIATDPTTARATMTAFSTKMTAYLDAQTTAGGAFDSRITSENDKLKDIKDRLDAFDAHMTARQAYLQKQFTALETVMNKNQSTLSQVSSYFA